MAKRKKFEIERENHDRWLISYADFITLLFAFFVVMYAISSVNKGKYQVLTTSLVSAFGAQKEGQTNNSNVSGGAINQNGVQKGSSFIRPFPAIRSRNEKIEKQREKMIAMALEVSKKLQPLVNAAKVHVIQNNRGLRIDVDSNLLFVEGSANIQPAGVSPLLEVANLLKEHEHAIQVEGHTDNIPIHNAQFFSNWELSAARASSVVRLFEQAGITESRLSAVGFGSAQPLTENNSEAGRSRNRRVSIMVLYEAPEAANDGMQVNP